MSDGGNGSKKRTVQIVVISVLVLVSLVVVVLSMTNVLVMKPDNLSDVAWRAGRQAYAIAEDYDSGRISTSEAAERLASVDMSYGTMDTGNVYENANNAHVAYCVQVLASDAKMQELHEQSGLAGLNDMHQSMRDDMADLADAIGYHH
ncbi:MAG: hypothetical protein LKJ49_09145 [Olsenella sp.]|jgi:hypothetical protein|nr:hypothetical protein [Olsenella sp.]